MPTYTVPFKTPLGQEELRTRGHKLGQRHRTLLFLIDGRRPLAEVLSLAHQAGAETQHFEDLLRMGLVELPPDPTPPPPPQLPVLTDEAALTSVDMVVVETALSGEGSAEATSEVAPPLPPPPVVEMRRIAVPDLPVLRDLPEGPFERTVRQPVPFVGEPAGASTRAAHAVPAKPPAATAKAAPAGRARKAAPPPVLNDVPEDPFERTQRLPGPSSAPADAVAKPPAPRSSPFKMRMGKRPDRDVPVLQEPVLPVPPASVSVKSAVASALPPAAPSPSPSLDIDLPIAAGEEARLLQRVRERLTEALRLDAPLFSARTFMRVRSAQSREELIDLVWEIQDHLSHRRRSHKELSSLHEARDLLGLGNTLVAGDESRPDYLDE
jgi:hypothetical protein